MLYILHNLNEIKPCLKLKLKKKHIQLQIISGVLPKPTEDIGKQKWKRQKQYPLYIRQQRFAYLKYVP